MKPYLIKTLIILTVFFINSSCLTRKVQPPNYYYGTFKFKQRVDEVFLKPSFITFLKNNPYCSFVLRVPNHSNKIVEEEKFANRTMYFALEKMLIEENFNVHERSLFENRILTDTITKPQTDLILELVNYKPINYYTNKIIPESSKEDAETYLPKYFTFTGAEVEFKIIHIKTNEIVATFILNYTPCTKGCKVKYTIDGYHEDVNGDFKTSRGNGYESADTDENLLMFKELGKKLVFELRRQRKEDK